MNTNSSLGQMVWKKLEKASNTQEAAVLMKTEKLPKKYDLFSLNTKELIIVDNTQIELPNANGGFSKFIIKESTNLSLKLAEKFPMIKSYTAYGLDDPTAVAKISLGTDGLHAVIFSATRNTFYIDPYTKDKSTFIAYKRADLDASQDEFTCQVEEFGKNSALEQGFLKTVNDGNLRTYRMAIVCSGEYAQFHLSNQNIPESATIQVKKAAVLSAMNTTLARVNGIFEKDLSVKMELVDNNDEIIFLDADNDGITDGNPNTMINEVQTICDNRIGNANYDIGHIFSIGGDGLASLGVVCETGSKARGVTGRNEPIGDPYDIDFVVHEIGHQFGATHTQNSSCQRSNISAVEPGSGSTIMGYAGICSPNVQGSSDDYFHAVSIAQMQNVITSTATCAILTETNNSAPTADAGAAYSIPKSTPFVLRGTATDADGISSLTYNWEQTDNEAATMPPLTTNTVGPMFRSLPSKTSPNRFMPDLATVVAGNLGTTWEVLPSVARELSFSFLVRDNNSSGGATARDNVVITVADAEAFTVTAPNEAVSWNAGSSQTISWNVGATNIAPINCKNVNIKLSIDGGLTFPIILKENTPNDGAEEILIPNNPTEQARIIVEAADNIFYNVNTSNFIINSTEPTFLVETNTISQTVCNSGNQIANYELSVDFINGFSEEVTFSTTGQPTNAVATFSPTSITNDGNVIMQISNLDTATAQNYTITVTGNSNTVSQEIVLELNVQSNTIQNPILNTPANNATEVVLTPMLTWSADSNASSYEVQIANDVSFIDIVSNTTVATNSFSANRLLGDTSYFWRVKPKNLCGEGSFSEIFTFTTLTPSYCMSTFTDEQGGTEHITNVTFNTINNNSGNDTVDGYQDFTSISTSLERGGTYEVSVTLDTGGFQDKCMVFIDWNQDFEFDKTIEKYDLGVEFENVGTRIFRITVPNDAPYGTTRMRVVIEYEDPDDGAGDGACDEDHQTEWGETEDYNISIVDVASIDDSAFDGFNLYPNPINGEFNLNFVTSDQSKVSLQLYDVRGRLIEEKEYLNIGSFFSKKILFQKTTTGLYLLKITNGDEQTTRKIIFE
ncbi:reprolysin-like metallopeptidase [uncultured Polaribacter sp.]|uniref:zinc-dependent metalloprotease n=1 Tax=uncultured Polaribacter sp. TaxID=174711 RepID=UPI002611F2BD|nr:zinc-dependent metalloprotease family protein [uncultured Polaribacter sp.]